MLKKRLAVLVLSLFVVSCAKAPQNDNEPPNIKSVDVVTARPQEATLALGESGDALVRLQIANGYHINANPPSQAFLKPTEIELKPAEGISVEFIKYPDPLVRTFSFSETQLKVYEGDTELKLRLKADKSATPGKHNLSAKLRVQACDDKVCYAPGELDLVVPVSIK
jgi:DsbC/DsbD-like thiol-disulfide interchange protein